jgi:3-oxoacyl-[acyl-carrier protein] reductase
MAADRERDLPAVPAVKVCVMGATRGLGTWIASEFGVKAIDLGEYPPEECDGVVILVGADPPPSLRPLKDMSEVEWRDAAETAPLRAMHALQRAHASTTSKCGSIVVVTPSVGLIGASGLSHYVTGIEAVRAMAKSAARQWASDRVSVSLIVVPLGLIVDGAGDLVPHIGRATRKDADLMDAVARAVDFILSGTGPALTGSTLVVDGGAVMIP